MVGDDDALSGPAMKAHSLAAWAYPRRSALPWGFKVAGAARPFLSRGRRPDVLGRFFLDGCDVDRWGAGERETDCGPKKKSYSPLVLVLSWLSGG